MFNQPFVHVYGIWEETGVPGKTPTQAQGEYANPPTSISHGLRSVEVRILASAVASKVHMRLALLLNADK